MSKTVVEKFRLQPCVGGFRIQPLSAKPEDQQLIRELCRNDVHEMTEVLHGELAMLVGTLMLAAGERGLLLEPKGELRNPVLHLSRVEKLAPKAGELRPFAALPGRYAAHWGVTDLYPEHRTALAAALATGQPFDSGRFGAKKEIEYARIRRAKAGGPVTVTVWCEADDGIALADTAFWAAAGGNAACGCGREALEKLGLSDDEITEELGNLAEAAEIGDTNEVRRKVTLTAVTTMDEMMEKIVHLVVSANQELTARTARMTEMAKERLLALQSGGGSASR